MVSIRINAAAAVCAGLYLSCGAALAQQAAPAEITATPAEETADDLVIVPRRSSRTEPGVATAKTDGAANWDELRDDLKEKQAEQEAFDRQMRAMALSRVVTEAERERLRPKGLRAVSATQMQIARPERVASARLPVIVPLRSEIVNNMRAAVQPNAYTIFAELPDGAFFEMMGTRMRVVGGTDAVIKSRLTERRRSVKRLEAIDAPYTISRHEYGVDLSFSKFNIAYLLTVECPEPETDARCADDAYIVSLTQDMGVLNADGGE